MLVGNYTDTFTKNGTGTAGHNIGISPNVGTGAAGKYGFDYSQEGVSSPIVLNHTGTTNFSAVVSQLEDGVVTFFDNSSVTHSNFHRTDVDHVDIQYVGLTGSQITYNFKFYT